MRNKLLLITFLLFLTACADPHKWDAQQPASAKSTDSCAEKSVEDNAEWQAGYYKLKDENEKLKQDLEHSTNRYTALDAFNDRVIEQYDQLKTFTSYVKNKYDVREEFKYVPQQAENKDGSN